MGGLGGLGGLGGWGTTSRTEFSLWEFQLFNLRLSLEQVLPLEQPFQRILDGSFQYRPGGLDTLATTGSHQSLPALQRLACAARADPYHPEQVLLVDIIPAS